MSLRTKEQLIGLGFVSPWIIGFIVFMIYPIFNTILYSFSEVRFLLNAVQTTFVGFFNYTDVLLKDPDFKLALPQYFMQLLLFVPMVVIFSLMLSLLLNSKLKGRSFFRALFFLPVIIMSGPVVDNLKSMNAITLQGLFNFPVYKFIAQYLPSFVSVPILYVFNNAVLILWHTGVQTLIFLSALQKIDRSMFEASMVDGASSWQQFWKLTLPVLRPFIFLNIIYTVMDVSMSTLNPIIVQIKLAMFNIRKGFGFAAAASWIYFIIILFAVMLAYLLFGREKE
ncbi:carbohydrate ABC transporter permease [Caldicoprobacter guelmensis]|uniref:carbohydrate ABC transporter permease n=1 Tax=Caldicoprobacter guelmensis TaxID=1170224 RepID=UPI001958C311|nr:sugar ABC transporter permease [Caldicoprobacter guelmensis]